MSDYCEHGCCEIMPPFNAEDDPYFICADCGNDEGHEHTVACGFCGSTGLSPQAIEAREQADSETRRMRDHALQTIADDRQDPRTQNYFVRTDNNTVIRSEEEFNRIRGKVGIKIVDYRTAVRLAGEEKARQRKVKSHKSKAKASRQARKKNRSK